MVNFYQFSRINCPLIRVAYQVSHGYLVRHYLFMSIIVISFLVSFSINAIFPFVSAIKYLILPYAILHDFHSQIII